MMKTAIEISQSTKLKPMTEVAKLIGIPKKQLILYGNFKAKVPYSFSEKLKNKKDGKLILVTAITPTSAGEGKTTTTIGLSQALWKLEKKSIICLREPSLGPCFGIKGGATGGGLAQVLPMEEIDLHFTGDIHAIGSAHNLLSAMIDNSIFQGNPLNIDKDKISWPRVVDINDRALRAITLDLGHGQIRESRFDISVVSEIMAILCLSQSLTELKERLGKIIIGTSLSGKPIFAGDLKAVGSMALLLRDALSPNLVQTSEGTPAFIHGGPFANIAHGCNSIIATKLALKLVDYVVTEAGFGADLGAEKFFDIKCRVGKLKPSSVVLVVSVRALKVHGHGDLISGLVNLEKHLENLSKFNLPFIVAINRFSDDKKSDLELIRQYCQEKKVAVSICEAYEKGGKGAVDLAKQIIKISNKQSQFKYLYDLDQPPEKIMELIAKEIYGASGVEFTPEAKADLKKYHDWGLGNLLVCMAKTQYSFSDNPKLLGRPKNFKIKINSVRIANGAGFYIAITGKIMTMPGLPKQPNAEKIDIDESGEITGLF